MTERLYQNVPTKSNPAVLADAYAASNSEEYFAELTEAFFGENDFYPWNGELLKIYDPEGYQMVATVWDVKAK
jgi:Mlc titration factor MtfA (ptsG expression regulator)